MGFGKKRPKEDGVKENGFDKLIPETKEVPELPKPDGQAYTVSILAEIPQNIKQRLMANLIEQFDKLNIKHRMECKTKEEYDAENAYNIFHELKQNQEEILRIIKDDMALIKTAQKIGS